MSFHPPTVSLSCFIGRRRRWPALALALIVLSGCDKRDDDDGRPLEFKAEVELLESSTVPTLAQIAPYDEALTVCEYRIRRLLSSTNKSAPKQGTTIRVANWAVVAGKDQAQQPATETIRKIKLTPLAAVAGLDRVYTRNDLDFDLEEVLYLDLSQSLTTPGAPEKVRFDYRGPISYRMRIYWQNRHQLRLATIGNSHTGAAVDTRQFFQPENETTPVALNLSIPGCELPAQILVAENYLVDLPNLEWIVWGISPRIINKFHAYDRRSEIFRSSPGFQYDLLNHDRLWPAPKNGPMITAEALEDAALHKIEPWGWSPATHRDLPLPITPEASQKLIDDSLNTHFRWNQEAWKNFNRTVTLITERDIKLLLFTPPFHPLIAQGKAADFDDTGKKDYRKLVERLHALAAANDKVTFLDIHNNGDHEFLHEDFADRDHLHKSGTRKLTEKLIQIVEPEA